MTADADLFRWFRDIDRHDVALVGGKSASLGEMFTGLRGLGVTVPDGFSSTVQAYHAFLAGPPGLPDRPPVDAPADLVERARGASSLAGLLEDLFRAGDDLHARAVAARAAVLATPLPPAVEEGLRRGYAELCHLYGREVDAAVRSSATREDSTLASFAGQYESFLNVRGPDAIVSAWRQCVASAFTERALGYQLSHDMDPLEGAVAVVVMKMVRADLGSSGVMFTLDPDSGNRNVILVSSAYGLGETVVQGTVSPDTFLVWKEGLRRDTDALVHRTLGAKDRKMVYGAQGGTATESVDVDASLRRRWSISDADVIALARMALTIEEHYGRPMDIEWARDGQTHDLFIVQARPETVHGNRKAAARVETWRFEPGVAAALEAEGRVLARGTAVGTRIGSGAVRRYLGYDEVIERKRHLRGLQKEGVAIETLPAHERVFDDGDVLVTELTTPDWEPLMKRASLIVTEKGGRTSHAAIVAREFGIPAIVGCEGALELLEPLSVVTGSCAQGETAVVYEGAVPFEVERLELDELPETRTRIKLNVGFPDKALHDAMLPADGVGLARIEFILTAQVGIHPLALVHFRSLKDFVESGRVSRDLQPFADRLRAEDPHELATMLGAIERRTPGYESLHTFFVDRLKYGVGLICAAFHPRPVLVRLSDLKSNEYRELLGGRLFEPLEENPMIAWRGASRYIDPIFAPAFRMECEALRFVRREMGLDNLQVMVPFCRTPEEGKEVADVLRREGIDREHQVPLFLMVELPSNVVEARRFIEVMDLDGGSIGSNDLVQTVYAVSRDDLEHYRHPVDARSPAVRAMMETAIREFRQAGVEIGICGQAPSDFPDEVPPFLVAAGIDSISVTPDTALAVRLAVARAEAASA